MRERLKIYHLIWLEYHPDRTKEWLLERMHDGFHVHHVDGDHENNDPKNLLLIERADHLKLHNLDVYGLVRRASRRGAKSDARKKFDEIRDVSMIALPRRVRKYKYRNSIKLSDEMRLEHDRVLMAIGVLKG